MLPPLMLALGLGCNSDSPAPTTNDTGPVGDTDTVDFGAEDIDAAADCQGLPGLTGDALLAMASDGHTSTLRYVTADADFVDPTPVTVTLTWPETPSFSCFPAWDETPLYAAEPRVGIDGLTLTVSTGDGRFDETLDARGWLFSQAGIPLGAAVFGVTSYADLEGDWVPFPEYGDGALATLDFQVGLSAAGSGSVGMGTIPLDRMRAGVFGSRFAVATWPHEP